MKRLTLMLCAAASLVGCGEGVPPGTACPEEGCEPVDARLAGVFEGTAETHWPEKRVTSAPMRLATAADGITVHGLGLCGPGLGGFIALGAGPYAESRQTVECPAPTARCPSAVFAYVNTALTVSDEGRVSVAARGFHTGCEESVPVTTTLLIGP